MSNRIHLPNGVPQGAGIITRSGPGPNQTPAIVLQQDPGGLIVTVIGGATRIETIASRIAAGMAGRIPDEEIASRSLAIAKSLVNEMSQDTPEPTKES